jgi:uncharacterized protein (TIGR02145 family)
MEQNYEYDVSLSFAGEDRDYVRKVAELLVSKKIKVFYDEYEKTKLWGKNLYTHLDEVYRLKSKFCVIFISKNYKNKIWTNHEMESAQARALKENKEYILPFKIDDTDLPGLKPTISYLSVNDTTSQELANIIEIKVKGIKRVKVPETSPPKETDHNHLEISPEAWENGFTKLDNLNAIFTDPRDDQTYKVKKMNDGNWWLTENFNYNIEDSWFYDNNPKNGEIYGRLYTWKAAQRACPEGWILPSLKTWLKLIDKYVRRYSWFTHDEKKQEKAYKKFIRGGDSRFNARLAGRRSIEGVFEGIDKYGSFWSSEEIYQYESFNERDEVLILSFGTDSRYYGNGRIKTDTEPNPNFGFSVRYYKKNT